MEEVGNDECDHVSSEVETSQAVYEFNTCEMNARNVRQIYLITYSMVDTERFPTRLFTVPYFFVRSFRYTASSYRNGYLDFKMYRGGGRWGLWLGAGGEGREK